jgi:predicted metal-dependent hydrolase
MGETFMLPHAPPHAAPPHAPGACGEGEAAASVGGPAAAPAFERRAPSPREVRPRHTAFHFPASLPRHWAGGSAAKTALFNAVNLFIVPFEDFMVRVMRAELPHLREEGLRRQVRGFMGQEATHARAHERYVDNLRAQGYRVDGYLGAAGWTFSVALERWMGARVSGAAIAGFEHLTALLAEVALDGDLLEDCEPALREVWAWHAAEELEHKALAFDLLAARGGGYGLRAAGALLGAAVVAGFIAAGMALLLWQDRALLRRSTWRDVWALFFGRYRIAPRGAVMFARYFRPAFHPLERDTDHLARPVLAPAAGGGPA